jgi:putative transposase
MSLPRNIVPGMTVMITRRTVQRTFLFRPEPIAQQIYLYCLALFAQRHGIQVHVPMLMSTHEHLMVTDLRGELPDFLRDFHRTVALCIKAWRGWEGPVWDHDRTSIVHIATPDAFIETAAYLIANPVTAGLVAHSTDWPGVTIAPDRLGQARLQIERPDVYFSAKNSQWPEQVTLDLVTPDNFQLSDATIRRAVADEVVHLEAVARSELQLRGLQFLTAHAIADCSPFERAKSIEPSRRYRPTFSVGRHQKQALLECVSSRRHFHAAYREALNQWQSGVRDVVFPRGTWLMHRLHRARVDAGSGNAEASLSANQTSPQMSA